MAKVTYSQPTWGTLENISGISENVTNGSSTPISYQGTDSELTAFQFCSEFDYSLVGFVVGQSENPTVSYDVNNQQWENDTTEPIFLQIDCDNGVNETIAEVNIANVGDLIFLLGFILCVGIIQVFLLMFGRN